MSFFPLANKYSFLGSQDCQRQIYLQGARPGSAFWRVINQKHRNPRAKVHRYQFVGLALLMLSSFDFISFPASTKGKHQWVLPRFPELSETWPVSNRLENNFPGHSSQEVQNIKQLNFQGGCFPSQAIQVINTFFCWTYAFPPPNSSHFLTVEFHFTSHHLSSVLSGTLIQKDTCPWLQGGQI